jgi:hypothetical protein
MKFQHNVGAVDRAIRTVVGVTMIYFGFIQDSFLQDPFAAMLLGVFGGIVFLSALLGVCPLYNLIGFNSSNSRR